MNARNFRGFLPIALAAVTVASLIGACAKTPVTGRRAFILLSEDEELKLGADAYKEALKSEKIMGAGLDVMVDEPPRPDHPMLALPNVTLTPHSAGPTWDNWWARFRNGFDNIERVASGRAPLWVIPELASQ